METKTIRAILAAICVAAAISPSWAGTVKWNGSAGDGKMSTGANWDGGTAPAADDTLDFSAVVEGDTIIADIANSAGRHVRRDRTAQLQRCKDLRR